MDKSQGNIDGTTTLSPMFCTEAVDMAASDHSCVSVVVAIGIGVGFCLQDSRLVVTIDTLGFILATNVSHCA